MSVSVSFSVMNWQSIGSELARLILSTVFTLVLGAFVFRRYFAPEIQEALEEAQATVQKIASLGGIKKADYAEIKELETAVTADIVKSRIPELEMVRLAVPAETWEKIEEAFENNPAGVLALWEKWKPYFTEQSEQESLKQYDFA